MSTIDRVIGVAGAGLTLARATVMGVRADGRVSVRPVSGAVSKAASAETPCDVLEHTASGAAPLARGETVLVGLPPQGGVGIVLGRIGRVLPAPAPVQAAAPETPPARLHLSATEEITLECGGATIRITGDGRVVIRGEHILTRAKGTQRIKGGSVAIN